MKIWIDLGNSPHVAFFKSLASEFAARDYEVVWTARDYAQTVELAKKARIDATVFGTHGGKNIFSKAAKFAKRVLDLTKWARGKKIDLAVSHNSQEPLVAARLLGIRSVNLMDYEHHPGNHLSFRAANRVIVPASFPDEALKKFGAASKVRKFEGIKEDVYLSGFQPDPNFADELKAFGIEPEHILVVVRPHAPEALYHRGVENKVLDSLLNKMASNENVRIIVLPRKDYQGDEIRASHTQQNIIIPKRTLEGGNLVAAADLVISGGGTMNREAAALGVPAYTVFAGKPASIDSYLADEGRLVFVLNEDDIEKVSVAKKPGLVDRGMADVRKTVADLILED